MRKGSSCRTAMMIATLTANSSPGSAVTGPAQSSVPWPRVSGPQRGARSPPKRRGSPVRGWPCVTRGPVICRQGKRSPLVQHASTAPGFHRTGTLCERRSVGAPANRKGGGKRGNQAPRPVAQKRPQRSERATRAGRKIPPHRPTTLPPPTSATPLHPRALWPALEQAELPAIAQAA